MHPSEKVKLKDRALAGKRIIIGITGSIAAVETVKLIRELLRHGAEITPVMSSEAAKLIHPYAVEFASGFPPITEITGQVEHVVYCGDGETAVDLMLIAPATANTISKIACGIDDTPVTTFATTALGTGVPLLISPSMHGTMYDHRIVQENIIKLKNMGVGFIEPAVSEGKAKMPSREMIVEHVIRILSIHDRDGLAGKSILIIGGSTAQPVDAMRVLTNRSSGGTAVSLATEAFRKGAELELWYGWGQELPPDWTGTVERFTTVQDLLDLVESSSLEHDAIILCAAISDYSPEQIEGKLPSGSEDLVIQLSPTPKIILKVREKAAHAVLVGFKAESGISEEELISRAEERMKGTGCQIMVANLLEDVGEEKTQVYILDISGGVGEVDGSRMDVARSLFEVVSHHLEPSNSQE